MISGSEPLLCCDAFPSCTSGLDIHVGVCFNGYVESMRYERSRQRDPS